MTNLLFLLLFLLPLLTSSSPPTSTSDMMAFFSASKNPLSLISEHMQMIEGLKCRSGYGNNKNITLEVQEASSYCAGLKFTRKRSRKFKPEGKVPFERSETPFLCLKACVLFQTNVLNENGLGLNETSLFNFFYSMSSGHEFSVFVLTKELMECDRRHPTTFPTKNFENCEATEEFFRCFKRVFTNCNHDNDQEKYKDDFAAFLTSDQHKMLKEMEEVLEEEEESF